MTTNAKATLTRLVKNGKIKGKKARKDGKKS